jgi:PIN domain nuclease of toxin-antitoxin system
MNLLIDTHVLIWFLNGDSRLLLKTRKAIEDSKNTKYVSIASLWEITIKISLDKFRFINGFRSFIEMVNDNGFIILPITTEHTLAVSNLDFIHRDPFDRILIAQCKCENFTIATQDENIKLYNLKTI